MKSILYFCFEKCLIALTHLHIVPVLQLPLLKTKVSLHTKKALKSLSVPNFFLLIFVTTTWLNFENFCLQILHSFVAWW